MSNKLAVSGLASSILNPSGNEQIQITPTITDITYANLAIAITAGTLIKGAFYRITDYKTAHYILNAAVFGIPEAHLGSLEPLIVFALDEKTLHHQAYSELYPNDIIHYDVNNTAAIDGDIAFSDSGTPFGSLKGIITYRKDTTKNISTHYDFRNVIFRRWKLNLATYNAATTYPKYAVVTEAIPSHIYISKSGVGNVGEGFNDNFWSFVLDIDDVGLYSSWQPTDLDFGLFIIPVDDTSYEDVSTFEEYNSCSNIEIGLNDLSIMSSLGYPLTRLNNIVFKKSVVANSLISNFKIDAISGYSTIYGQSFNNNIGGFFYNNITGIQFSLNNISTSCCNNVFCSNFTSNTVGADFYGNAIGRTTNYNTFSYGFSENILSSSTDNNFFGSGLSGCVFLNSLANNNFRHRAVLGTDFLAATHINSPYECDIFRRSDSTVVLSYVDSTDNWVIVLPTD